LRLTGIFGLATSRPHIYETSALGAAIDAAVGLGLHPNFDTAVKAMTRIGQTFEPNAEHHATYNALYHRVYQKMYGRYNRCTGRFSRLRGIQGCIEGATSD